MTINAWRNEILNTCKYCKRFVDVTLFRGKRIKHRHWCDKDSCNIYSTYCSKTEAIWKQMPSEVTV